MEAADFLSHYLNGPIWMCVCVCVCVRQDDGIAMIFFPSHLLYTIKSQMWGGGGTVGGPCACNKQCMSMWFNVHLPDINITFSISWTFETLIIKSSVSSRHSVYGAMGCRIDSSWLIHWAICCSNQCSTADVIKTMICSILSVGWCI